MSARMTRDVYQAWQFLLAPPAPPAGFGTVRVFHPSPKFRAYSLLFWASKQLVPLGVRFLTCSVDVQAGQRRGFVIQVMGWGLNREHWIVDRYALMSSERLDEDGKQLPIDPAAYAEDWSRLIEKCITRRYLLADGSGRSMPTRLTVCDSGGEEGVTNRAYAFHRLLVSKRLDHRFRLVKGGSGAGPRVNETYPDTRNRSDRNSGSAGDVPVLILGVDSLKDTVAGDLARETPGPGYYHFPDWLPTSAYDELTAEVRTAKGWTRVGRKNESLDLCCYAEAAYIRLKGEEIDWTKPPTWAAPWDANPDVRIDGEPIAPPRPRRPLRVVRSKHMGR